MYRRELRRSLGLEARRSDCLSEEALRTRHVTFIGSKLASSVQHAWLEARAGTGDVDVQPARQTI